jgi:DNA-binding MarR family transcriptional regulator
MKTASQRARNPEADETADRLRPIILKLSRHLRREAQKVGVSALDAQLLGIIKLWPGVGVSELAQTEQMSRPAMSAHVKRLEAAGWIARKPEDTDADKRRVALIVTAKGLQALTAIRRSRNDWLAGRLALLSPAERMALEAGLAPLGRLVEARS